MFKSWNCFEFLLLIFQNSIQKEKITYLTFLLHREEISPLPQCLEELLVPAHQHLMELTSKLCHGNEKK